MIKIITVGSLKERYLKEAIEEYQKITATHRNMADMLGCPESAEIDFEPTPLQKTLFANVDLS